ncbi:sigma-70 family RNA polymerase sigma factor [Nocardioides sambongensis]|uniref:sigma-70 family RNA polymerase sigma factor n=1 Tax=Nocardioides sambongensis TaxID=2589074 RepID=UPI00112B41EB|nr:sigma-70 family RNA polymerase sigma factor [Nocardioides sambongensis]
MTVHHDGDDVARNRTERDERTDALFALRRTASDAHAIDEEIIRLNMPVARSIARRFEHRGLAVDDLTQVAYLGLVKAVQNFDPDRGGSFLGYAVPTVRGEVRRWFRDAGWMVRPPRSVQELQPRIVHAQEELTHVLGREPELAELAAELGEPESEVRRAMSANGCFQPSSLDAPDPHGDDDAPGLVGLIGEPDPGYRSAEARVVLGPVLRTLDDRERMILELWLHHGVTQAEIGRRIGVTQTQVSRLITALLRRMRGQLVGETPAAA